MLDIARIAEALDRVELVVGLLGRPGSPQCCALGALLRGSRVEFDEEALILSGISPAVLVWRAGGRDLWSHYGIDSEDVVDRLMCANDATTSPRIAEPHETIRARVLAMCRVINSERSL